MFFIYWGRKAVRRRLGRVADYCPICREYRPFRASKIDTVGHIYSIPLGSRATLGYSRTCESCLCTVAMQPLMYPSISKDRRAGVNDLIRETHPRILEHWCDRLQLEDRARDGLLSADERREFILEPFVLLNQRVEERASRQGVDWCVGLGLLAAVAAVGYVISYVKYRNPGPNDLPTEVVVGIAVASVLLLFHAIGSRLRRFTQAQILPVIARSLRTCSPTSEELEATVRHLRRIRTPIGRALRIKDVQKAFEVHRSAKIAHGAWK